MIFGKGVCVAVGVPGVSVGVLVGVCVGEGAGKTEKVCVSLIFYPNGHQITTCQNQGESASSGM